VSNWPRVLRYLYTLYLTCIGTLFLNKIGYHGETNYWTLGSSNQLFRTKSLLLLECYLPYTCSLMDCSYASHSLRVDMIGTTSFQRLLTSKCENTQSVRIPVLFFSRKDNSQIQGALQNHHKISPNALRDK
jgi:hypothetical protein